MSDIINTSCLHPKLIEYHDTSGILPLFVLLPNLSKQHH